MLRCRDVCSGPATHQPAPRAVSPSTVSKGPVTNSASPEALDPEGGSGLFSGRKRRPCISSGGTLPTASLRPLCGRALLKSLTSQPISLLRGGKAISQKETCLVNTIDHIGIVVSDTESVVSWFGTRLGLVVVHSEVLNERNVRLTHLSPAGAAEIPSLQLVEPVGPGPIHDYLVERGAGLHHICFGVADMATTVKSASPSAEPETYVGVNGRLACFIDERPAGVYVELIE